MDLITAVEIAHFAEVSASRFDHVILPYRAILLWKLF